MLTKNMKAAYKFLTFIGAGLMLAGMTGCSADFLDREPTGNLTPEQIERSQWNSNVMLGMSNATTRIAISLSSSSQDDFGQKAIDIVSDMLSGDAAMRQNMYGWFRTDLLLDSYHSTSSRSLQFWNYNYSIIYEANGVISSSSGGTGEEPEDPEFKYYYAVGKTMRAYSYFNLVTLFGKNWSEGADDKVCPFVTYQSEDGVPVPGSTVDQVYDSIIVDLEDAIAAFDNATAAGVRASGLSNPDVDVARMILASALLQRGNVEADDYVRAKDLALAVVNGSGCSVLPYNQLTTTGFNTVNPSNWLWGFDITTSNTTGLASFWGFMDIFTYGYADVGDIHGINSHLYDAIPATDGRKAWFLSPEDAETVGLGVGYAYAPWQKFYDPAYSLGGDRSWTNDLVFMRYEEAVLVAAEAAARSNDLNTSRQMLKLLLDQRDPAKSATVDAMDQNQLLDELFFFFLVELWGEGRSLLTMKRFKRNIQRSEASLYYPNVAVNYDDERLYFETPRSVIQNNPDFRN